MSSIPDSRNRHTWRVAMSAASGLLLIVVCIGLVGWFAGAAGEGRARPDSAGVYTDRTLQQEDAEVYLPSLDGYPPPEATYLPSPSPVPPGAYYPIPDGIQHQVVTLQSAPDSDLLAVLQAELDAEQADALADRASEPFTLGLGEPCANAVWRDQLADVLDGLFAAGSQPMIQGYFRTEDGVGQRILSIVVAPWQGDVDIPTPVPAPWCDKWPIEPSVWVLEEHYDTGTWAWSSWWPGTYDTIVRRRAAYSTYYVVRP